MTDKPSALVAPSAVRVWRGFRLPSLEIAQFYDKLGTVFVPATVLMQIDAGLHAYAPTVPAGAARSGPRARSWPRRDQCGRRGRCRPRRRR